MSAQGEAASRPTRLGRYELITRIGQGGMAEVQLALQRGPAGFEKLVVVKLVHDSLASQKAFVDMLLDEARVAALVKHPNVVDIYDLGQAEGRYFIAMEYLEGEPLLAVLRAGREGKRLDPLSTGRLIADTAEGLDAAHELRSMSGERLELVHHDISLGNIVVLYNGQVKLVDFGVAKATQTASSNTKVQGKFSYMAPEKLRGLPGDRRSDIFSLGCVMWEALTLKRLFRGGNDGETMKAVLEMTIQPPSKINGDVPPEYDAIVMRALDRDPEKRQLTAKELAVEIEELLRKRGYGAKNDRIARYMQETFKDHIDARKKLVQEVVSQGSASAEILDAAFRDPLIASGSPVTPTAGSEFSVKYQRVSAAVPIPTSAFADSSKPTEISPPPIHDASGSRTEISAPPIALDEELEPPEVAVVETTYHGPPGLADKVRELLADKRKRLFVAGGGGLLLLVIVIATVAGGGGGASSADKTTGAAAGSDEGSGTVAGLSVDPDGSGGSATGDSDSNGSGAVDVEGHAGAAGSARPEPPDHPGPGETSGSHVGDDHAAGGSGDGSDVVVDDHHDGSDAGNGEIAMNPLDTQAGSGSGEEPDQGSGQGSGQGSDQGSGQESGHGPGSGGTKVNHHRPPPPERPNAEALFRSGLKSFVKGDTRGALGYLQRAKAANPGYAPTWRLLGQIYEKLGDRGAAKNAYQKYLALAPRAGDAPQIRQRLGRL